MAFCSFFSKRNCVIIFGHFFLFRRLSFFVFCFFALPHPIFSFFPQFFFCSAASFFPFSILLCFFGFWFLFCRVYVMFCCSSFLLSLVFDFWFLVSVRHILFSFCCCCFRCFVLRHLILSFLVLPFFFLFFALRLPHLVFVLFFSPSFYPAASYFLFFFHLFSSSLPPIQRVPAEP